MYPSSPAGGNHELEPTEERPMAKGRISRRTLLVAAGGLAAAAASTRAWSQGAPAVVTARPPIRLRYGHSQPDGHSTHRAALRFVEVVRERTGGSVTVDLFPNNQLGTDRELQTMIETGSLDFTHTNSATLGAFVPQIGVMDLPFTWRSPEHYLRVVDGPFGGMINAITIARTGHRFIAWWFDGFRNVYTRSRAVNAIGDMRGLKIRAPESRIFVDTFRALGANPTPLAFPEIYTALDAGTIDGYEGSNGIIWNSRLHEVTRYRVVTGHIMVGFGLVVRNARFTALPQDVQGVIVDAAREAQRVQRALQMSEEDELATKFTTEGRLTESRPDLAPFRAAVQSVHEEFHRRNQTTALRDAIEAGAS